MTDVPISALSLLMLGVGAVLGGLAHLLLPRPRRLTWSATVIVAVLGASIVGLALEILGTEERSVGWLLGSVLGAVMPVAAADSAKIVLERRRARGAPGVPAASLVAAGEGERVEFKSTARRNLHTRARDDRMEAELVVTVAGFLNATGGTLLIGVADDGAILGIEDDLELMPRPDRDGYELWLRDLLATRVGRAATADVAIGFEMMEGRVVCRVDVPPADRPAYVNEGKGPRTADFHLRIGNTTRKLLTDEVVAYTERRWG
jgi:uncharacterized membrane protein YeaQ/YmgE (transglycosylase-associated protein family)